jgi:hypothetical protein
LQFFANNLILNSAQAHLILRREVAKTLESRDAGAGPTASTAGIAPLQDPNARVGLTGSMDGSAALTRAREMDEKGKEVECMDAIREAKRLSGVQ